MSIGGGGPGSGSHSMKMVKLKFPWNVEWVWSWGQLMECLVDRLYRDIIGSLGYQETYIFPVVV